MTIPKYPAILTVTPRRDRVPGIDTYLEWPLHGSTIGRPGTPVLTIVTEAGAALGAAWTTDPFRYTFPTDNGNSNAVYLLAEHDGEAGDSSIDSALTLVEAPADTQICISHTMWWVDHADSIGYAWAYGTNTADASLYGFQLSTGDLPTFITRGRGASTTKSYSVANGNLTLASGGTVLSDAGYRSTPVACVVSIRVIDSDTAGLEMRFYADNGTPVSATYTGTVDWTENGGTAGACAPGQATATANQHGGFGIGARYNGTANGENYFGRGATNVAAGIGDVRIRKWVGDYDSGRAAAIIADMVSLPNEIPATYFE